MTTLTASRIVEEECVTVSAGTFTFLSLDSISLPPGVDLNQTVGGKATSGVWYARGAGLIEDPSAADSLGTVLTKWC